MDDLTITIPIKTDMDPSQLLDLIIDIVDNLKDDIETYGCEVEIEEDEVGH